MMTDFDEEFAQAEGSGASMTFPVQSSALRKNGYVCIKGRPCKIVDMSISKTGKHGHAKVNLIALDIFTGKKFEDMCPSTHNMDVPYVKRCDYQLLGIDRSDGFMSLLSDTGKQKRDLRVPIDSELGEAIKTRFAAGEELLVTVLSCMGEEMVVAVKANPMEK